MAHAVELDSVTKSFGNLVAVDSISFSVAPGATVALLGPSGCGKTTALRLIAGFETPEQGTIQISGAVMNNLRPYERSVGLLFQDYALFPHMTVADNIKYGMRRRGFAKDRMEARLSSLLNLIQLPQVADRYPSQLSGGQQQRVALARAFAIEPAIMLLDEPLSALDTKLRQELRQELRTILSSVGTTTIIVTHDQEEALSLADEIFVMNLGTIAQHGTPKEIYKQPKNRFVADFMGRMNWFPSDPSDSLGAFARRVIEAGRTIRSGNGDSKLVGVRPECVTISRRHIDGSSASFAAKVSDAVFLGGETHISLKIKGSSTQLQSARKNIGESPPALGENVFASFLSNDCVIVDP